MTAVVACPSSSVVGRLVIFVSQFLISNVTHFQYFFINFNIYFIILNIYLIIFNIYGICICEVCQSTIDTWPEGITVLWLEKSVAKRDRWRDTGNN